MLAEPAAEGTATVAPIKPKRLAIGKPPVRDKREAVPLRKRTYRFLCSAALELQDGRDVLSAEKIAFTKEK